MESQYFSRVNCYVTMLTIKDAFISVLQNVLTFQISITIWVSFNQAMNNHSSMPTGSVLWLFLGLSVLNFDSTIFGIDFEFQFQF